MKSLVKIGKQFQNAQREYKVRLQVKYKEVLYGKPPGERNGDLTSAVPPDMKRLSKLFNY